MIKIFSRLGLQLIKDQHSTIVLRRQLANKQVACIMHVMLYAPEMFRVHYSCEYEYEYGS